MTKENRNALQNPTPEARQAAETLLRAAEAYVAPAYDPAQMGIGFVAALASGEEELSVYIYPSSGEINVLATTCDIDLDDNAEEMKDALLNATMAFVNASPARELAGGDLPELEVVVEPPHGALRIRIDSPVYSGTLLEFWPRSVYHLCRDLPRGDAVQWPVDETLYPAYH